MSVFNKLLICFAFSMFLAGCATDEILIKRQAESEAKIELLIQHSKKSEQQYNELAALLKNNEEKVQSAILDIQTIKEETGTLRTSRDELKSKVTTLSQQKQIPKVEIVNPQYQPKTLTENGPPAEYLKAFGLYSANNFITAIEAFEAFIINNPQSEYAANSLYWIGECYYTLADYPKARDTFAKVVGEYTKSSKTPDALLKLGYTFVAMKEKEKGAIIFEKIITNYPSSHAASKARERLR